MPIDPLAMNSVPFSTNGSASASCTREATDSATIIADSRSDPVSWVRVEVRQQQQELVAALARDEVGLTGVDAQPFRELGEQLVAGGVPQRVVHELEVVEVDEDHADPEVVPSGSRDRVLEHLLEQHPVRQARELVVIGEERDLFLGRLARRDVEDHALDQPRLTLLVLDRIRLLEHPLDRAVLVHHAVLVVQGRVLFERLLVLLPGPVEILGVDVLAPAVRVGQPLVGVDAEQRDHLRAHVDRVRVLVDRIEVDDRGDLLDERPVLRLGLEPRLASGLQLGRVAERHHDQLLGALDATDVHLHRHRAAAARAAEGLDRDARLEVEQLGRDEQLDRPAHQLVAAEARQPLHPMVREHDATVGAASRRGTRASPPAATRARSSRRSGRRRHRAPTPGRVRSPCVPTLPRRLGYASGGRVPRPEPMGRRAGTCVGSTSAITDGTPMLDP